MARALKFIAPVQDGKEGEPDDPHNNKGHKGARPDTGGIGRGEKASNVNRGGTRNNFAKQTRELDDGQKTYRVPMEREGIGRPHRVKRLNTWLKKTKNEDSILCLRERKVKEERLKF